MKESYRQCFALHVEKTYDSIQEAQELLNKADWRRLEITAMGAFLSDIYKGMEAVLRLFIEKIYEEKLEKNDSWHKNLIDRAKEKSLIPEGIERTIDGMRQYRHLQVHGYSIDLDEKQLRQNTPDAIAAYRAFVDHILERYPMMAAEQKMEAAHTLCERCYEHGRG
jgi:uncharacterized protein YutE (UPF0331/DUF86 family)